MSNVNLGFWWFSRDLVVAMEAQVAGNGVASSSLYMYLYW